MFKKIGAILMASIFSLGVYSKEIGEVETSGMFFKDSILIHSFNDPTLTGIACHVTYVDKSFSMDDPSDSAISCRQVASKITGNYRKNVTDVFSKSKNLFFKTMRVDRFYDSETNTLVYISYVRKMSGDNHAHSISSVPLYNAL